MSRTGPVVLMYHGVGSGPGIYSVRKDGFAEHLKLVKEVATRVSLARDLPDVSEDAVVVSFDDGNWSVVANALPLLQEAGLAATLFMTASAVGAPKRCSADDLREWCLAGNELATHGWNHDPLTHLPTRRAVDELRRSKETLEDIAGQPVRSVSFPQGQLKRSLIRAAADLGITAAFGSWPGYGRSRAGAFGRFAILRQTSYQTLIRVLEGKGGLAFAPERALFIASRVIGLRAYGRVHNLLQAARRGR